MATIEPNLHWLRQNAGKTLEVEIAGETYIISVQRGGDDG